MKMRKCDDLLTKVSGTTNLRELNNEDLFLLYTDYTINYPVKGRRFQYVKFRENSIYLAKEIMARNLTSEDMLEIAKIILLQQQPCNFSWLFPVNTIHIASWIC